MMHHDMCNYIFSRMTSQKNYTGNEREKVRLLLNREKVKLWLSPYTSESGDKGCNPDVSVQNNIERCAKWTWHVMLSETESHGHFDVAVMN